MNYFRLFAVLIIVVLGGSPASWAEPSKVEHVIIISFDGLRPDAIRALGLDGAPNFHDVIRNGASTLNARNDPDWTITMPNHTCMLTGRGVEGPAGHNYTDNASPNLSIHTVKGSYVPSIFDVAKQHGLSTGFFVSKLKFHVFLNSYKKNIDVSFVSNHDDAETARRFLEQASRGLPNLTFIHFSDPDHTAHRLGWSTRKRSAYLKAVKKDDGHLGEILQVIRANPAYRDSTVILMTADHGGRGLNHYDNSRFENYRVPLIIWGKGVATRGDLYKINVGTRRDPKKSQVPYSEPWQPIRNSDVANAAMQLLGLPLIAGSTIGNPDPLRVSDH
jgi:predicted AlkP superfamily pyrophosphatase or phosphodiesterase